MLIKRQYLKNGKMKYSSHYTVDKIRMSWYNIKLLIEKNKSQGLDMPDYDMTVYTKNRGVYGAYTNTKLIEGKTITLPPFLPEGDADISKYLISYIEEDFVDWDKNFASFQDSLKKCCKSTFMKNDFFEKFIDKKIELFAFTNVSLIVMRNSLEILNPLIIL
jgi:hypothetical protein